MNAVIASLILTVLLPTIVGGRLILSHFTGEKIETKIGSVTCSSATFRRWEIQDSEQFIQNPLLRTLPLPSDSLTISGKSKRKPYMRTSWEFFTGASMEGKGE